MTTPWLDVTGLKLRSVMPSEDVDRLESQYPGFLTQQIADQQGWIEDRLRKRYAIPFDAPYPPTAVRWLVALVTALAYQRRGFNPSSEENKQILDASTEAKAEIKEAADSNEGLFELPMRADLPSTSGATQGGPYAYSEASPYTWADEQVKAVRNGG